MRSLKKANGYALMGGLILASILVVVVFADHLPLRPPLQWHKLLIREDGMVVVPPFKPGNGFVLGSDYMGRDVLSRLIYGARLTLPIALSVALARMVLGVVLGGLAAFLPGWIAGRIKDFTKISTGIPALLFATIFLWVIRPWATGDQVESAFWFALILGLTGWGRTADLIRRRIETLLGRPFIEAAVAAGANRWRILVKHITPHLSTTIIIGLVLEAAQSLIMLGQLALFGIVAGGYQMFSNSSDRPYIVTYQPEWGTMLMKSVESVWSHPHLFLYVAVAFFVTILGFNLLGEGLRRKWEG